MNPFTPERKDEPRPELTPSESPDRYIEEIVRRDAEAAVRSEPPPRRGWRVPVVLASLAILAGLTAWNVVRVAREPEVFTPVQEEAGLNFTIYLVAEGIEAYRGSSGALPENLVVLGLDDDGVDYVTVDSGYLLTAPPSRMSGLGRGPPISPPVRPQPAGLRPGRAGEQSTALAPG